MIPGVLVELIFGIRPGGWEELLVTELEVGVAEERSTTGNSG